MGVEASLSLAFEDDMIALDAHAGVDGCQTDERRQSGNSDLEYKLVQTIRSLLNEMNPATLQSYVTVGTLGAINRTCSEAY